MDNLLLAWKEFLPGKKSKKDVEEFSFHLMENILSLHTDLVNRAYRHGGYQAFFVNDPKRRHIHKASVRDRLVHHALYRILYPFFDRTFIADSYSCRRGKGTHRAVRRFCSYAAKASRNHTRTCWVLKGDIKKFFASVDHGVLFSMLTKHISDKDILFLLENIIHSFHTDQEQKIGLPLGNLTSQLFINIYMNEFDQWVKHTLKAKHYIRYADDFVFLSEDKEWLQTILPCVEDFLVQRLHLCLHPDKMSLTTIASGVDFLGWVQFPDHRVLRTTTKRRMMTRIEEHPTERTIGSYMGLLRHGNAYTLRKCIDTKGASR